MCRACLDREGSAPEKKWGIRDEALPCIAGIGAGHGIDRRGGGCTTPKSEPAASEKQLDKVTYLTAFGAVGRDAFAWVAQEKGYFKESGLDVTIQLGAATGENLKVSPPDRRSSPTWT